MTSPYLCMYRTTLYVHAHDDDDDDAPTAAESYLGAHIRGRVWRPYGGHVADLMPIRVSSRERASEPLVVLMRQQRHNYDDAADDDGPFLTSPMPTCNKRVPHAQTLAHIHIMGLRLLDRHKWHSKHYDVCTKTRDVAHIVYPH